MKVKEIKKRISTIFASGENIRTYANKVLKMVGNYAGIGKPCLYSFQQKEIIYGRILKSYLDDGRLKLKPAVGVNFYVAGGRKIFYAVIGKNKRKYAVFSGIEKGNRKENMEKVLKLSGVLHPFLLRYEEYTEKKQLQADLIFLLKMGILLNSTLSQKFIRKKAMETITELLEAEAGSLLLLDEEREELYFEIALGEKGDMVKEIRLKLGEGIAGWVAKYGVPAIVNNPQRDKRWYRRADEKSKFKTRNILCVPVKSKGKVIGVLQALNKKNGDFSKYDLEIFETFSNQVAIALENAKLYEELKNTFLETSSALASSIEARDKYTGGHTQRVVNYSVACAEELGLKEEEIDKLRMAAVLHDVGKIGIDDSILRKPGKLDPEEIEQMKKHPQIGAEIISKVKGLKDIVPAVLYHQEMFNGTGYPEGLKNGDIPLLARIISVVDTFDAMTTDRPYRKALGVEAALDELKRCSGTQFDPEVVSAFIRAFEKGKIKVENNLTGAEKMK